MAGNHVQAGNIINYANATGATITSGAIVIVGTRCGVALVDIANGSSGAVALEDVFRLTKVASTEVIAQGANIFHDATNPNKVISASPDMSEDKYVGIAAKASANGDTTVDVLLQPSGYYELDTDT